MKRVPARLYNIIFPFCFSSLDMISAQQPPFPNKIQRTMDCQSKEEETCEEQYDSENCTCSSEHAESEKGLVQFKYCNCYGMLAYHILIFVSLQIADIIMQLFLWYPISPPLCPLMLAYIIRSNLQKYPSISIIKKYILKGLLILFRHLNNFFSVKISYKRDMLIICINWAGTVEAMLLQILTG